MAVIDRTLPLPALTHAVRALEAAPPSAEVAAALVGLLEDPPYTGQKTKQLWLSVLRQLGGVHASADVVAPLSALSADYRRVFGPTDMGQWLETKLARLVATLTSRFPEAPREVSPRAPDTQVAPSSIDDLVALVAARPDDDDARDVLADALMSRGDPRGEFISLQMRAHRGETLTIVEKKQERRMLAEHEKEWLGPVADVTKGPSRVWRRGFLDECDFVPRGKFLAPAVGHSAWSGLRTLRLEERHCRKALPVVMHPVLRNLRCLDWASTWIVEKMAACDPPWQVRRLRGWLLGYGKDIPHAMLNARGLPALRELWLSLDGFDNELERLRTLFWPSPLARQLSLLTLRFYQRPAPTPAWVDEIRAHARMPVELIGSTVVRIEGGRTSERPRGQQD